METLLFFRCYLVWQAFALLSQEHAELASQVLVSVMLEQDDVEFGLDVSSVDCIKRTMSHTLNGSSRTA